MFADPNPSSSLCVAVKLRPSIHCGPRFSGLRAQKTQWDSKVWVRRPVSDGSPF